MVQPIDHAAGTFLPEVCWTRQSIGLAFGSELDEFQGVSGRLDSEYGRRMTKQPSVVVTGVGMVNGVLDQHVITLGLNGMGKTAASSSVTITHAIDT